MEKYKVFWDYQKRKNGEIIIKQEELQKMLDEVYEAGYNRGIVETAGLASHPQEKAIPNHIKAPEDPEWFKRGPVCTSPVLSDQLPFSTSSCTSSEGSFADGSTILK